MTSACDPLRTRTNMNLRGRHELDPPFAARVSSGIQGAIGQALHAMQSGVLGAPRAQIDAALLQPGHDTWGKAIHFALEAIAMRNEIRQLDGLLHGEMPGENAHGCLGVVRQYR